MPVTRSLFGYADGKAVYRYCIRNERGCGVSVLTRGATLQALWVPDRAGTLRDLLPGYDTAAGYAADRSHFGATIGRCCNRTGGASFELDGRRYSLSANEGNNHLHGGFSGFERKNWAGEIEDDCTVRLTYRSPDGEEGYPGSLEAVLRVRFDSDCRLTLEYSATADADTLCNLTNHAYFNLNGQASGSVLDHWVQISANTRQQLDPITHLPTGQPVPVEGTAYDLRALRPLAGPDGPRVRSACYLLDADNAPTATVWAPASGICMQVSTTLPALVFYTDYAEKPGRTGKGGQRYGPYCGLCFETQYPVDAIHCPELPQPVLRAGQSWHHTTVFSFFADKLSPQDIEQVIKQNDN